MNPSVYYNEIDPHAAAWLQALMDADAIPRGDIDTRSIEDVTPNELRGYTQCHFFAGIGGWSYALDLAGWPRDRPVWTGSCPCQPFSAAGKGAGFADERHLWPAWQHLIAQCRPAEIFGEQVSGKRVYAWIDLVHADLEGLGYAFGCVPAPAAGFGAPHIRDRAYWVANSSSEGLEEREGNAELQRKAIWPPSWQASFCGIASLRDGTRRPFESGAFPLAHGIPARVVRLRGYGNAIVPLQAAAFVRAYLEVRSGIVLEAAA